MAIIEEDFGGFLRGRIGGQFTVYKRLGKTVMRSVPEGFCPTGEGQLAQQRRIKGCNTFYKAVRDAGLSECWKEALKPPGWSGFNLFMHHNLPAFSERGWMEAPEKVKLTAGEVLLPDKVCMTRGEETNGEVSDRKVWMVAWENAADYPRRDASDRAVVALMRGGKYYDVKFAEIVGNALREEKRLAFVQEENLKEYVHGYLFFRSANGKRISESMYLGILI